MLYDSPLDDLYDGACDHCGRKFEILDVYHDHAVARCDCGDLEYSLADERDEAEVYH